MGILSIIILNLLSYFKRRITTYYNKLGKRREQIKNIKILKEKTGVNKIS